MNILLTGGSGQLGKSIQEINKQKIKIYAPNKKQFDLSKPKECFQKIIDMKPDLIINCGAFTAVDEAEDRPDICYRINAEAPKEMAKALRKTGGKLIQISTDYVFDGKQNFPYKHNHQKNPISIYGLSKSAGEDAIIDEFQNNENFCIIRTSWLMGPTGKNFALSILKLHSQKQEIKVVNDQIGSPTSTYSLAKIIIKIIENYKTFNNKKCYLDSIIHWSDQGFTSWYKLAFFLGKVGLELGLLKRNALVIPIKSNDYPYRAKRPMYSILDCKETETLLNIKGIHWEKSLYKMLKEVNLNTKHI